VNLITCKGCIHEEICPNTNAYEDVLNVKNYCPHFIDKSALEKQIPKKGVRHGFDPSKLISSVSYTCPTCHSHISETAYCSTCGQALDWGDTE
jgi:hypothetical protein